MSKVIELFRKLSIEELMARELDMARRGLLLALKDRDLAEVSVDYHQKRIARLEAALAERGQE